jgi:hypothetical protein
LILVIFQIGSLFFAWSWPQTMTLSPTSSWIAGITSVLHHTQLVHSFNTHLFIFWIWVYLSNYYDSQTVLISEQYS